MSENKKGSPLTVIIVAVVALGVLSVLPWSRISGGYLKDFNLLSDLLPAPDPAFTSHEDLDPALAALTTTEQASDRAGARADSAATDSVLQPAPLPDDFRAPTAEDGTVLIEDYSPDGDALSRLKSALAAASARTVRVAVLGDSYIEGDIFTQNLRSLLQDRLGGSGVGYMAAHSEFPGFRQSVRQTSSGWTERDMRHIGSDPVKPLSGVYYSGGPGAKLSLKGSHRPAHADTWSRATALFIAPAAGSVTLASDGGAVTQAVDASDRIQSVALAGPATAVKLSTDIPGLKVLGVWLDTPQGVALDCMSMRGNSGLTLTNVSAEIVHQSRQWIDYDLIVVEYGINALSASQKNYSAYADAMVRGIGHIARMYPRAVILVMGIGDRGQKLNGAVRSMLTAPAMVQAQRDIARRTGSLFYDTRAAMGGENAAVRWHEEKLVNADYVHLNHKGGERLASIFVNSLFLSVK